MGVRTILKAVFILALLGNGDGNVAQAITAAEFVEESMREITDLEKRAEATPDPYQKAELYKKARETALAYLRRSTIEFDYYDPVLPSLSADDFHETTNFLKYVEITIAQKEKEIQLTQDPMARFDLLQDLIRFTIDAHMELCSEWWNPALTPRLGSDDLRLTSNLVNTCESVISDLKRQYDPFSCEKKSIIERDRLIRNMKKVEYWCMNKGLSDLFDPSLTPRYFHDPYGTEELYTRRVCGILPGAPEEERSIEPSPGPSLPKETVDCLAAMRAVSGENWTAPKRTLSTTNGDYCLLTRTTTVGPPPDYATAQQIFKITFLGSEDPLGVDFLKKLRVAESGEFKIVQEDRSSYSGYTANFGPSDAHEVMVYPPYCVAELTTTATLAVPEYHPDDPFYEWQKARVKESMSGTIGNLSNYWLLDQVEKVCQAGAVRIGDVARLPEAPIEKTKEEPKISSVDIEEVVPALAEQTPTADDLKASPLADETKKGQITAVVLELDGTADMRLADGTWMIIEEGSFIPPGATIFAGYGSTVKIQLSDHLVFELDSLSEVNLLQYETDASVYRQELNLESGGLRFKVLEGDLKTDPRVSTPNASASPSGTDFAVSYLKGVNTSLWEIYDGAITVTDMVRKASKTISSSYGSPIRRLKVTQDGSMIEKIAIPQNEWENFVFSKQLAASLKKSPVKKSTVRWWPWVVLGLLVMGVGYWTYTNRLKKTP